MPERLNYSSGLIFRVYGYLATAVSSQFKRPPGLVRLAVFIFALPILLIRLAVFFSQRRLLT